MSLRTSIVGIWSTLCCGSSKKNWKLVSDSEARQLIGSLTNEYLISLYNISALSKKLCNNIFYPPSFGPVHLNSLHVPVLLFLLKRRLRHFPNRIQFPPSFSAPGFVTLSVLAKDADQDNLFKCGIAVAPVTNWIYYDTIYTERYMGLPLPQDNAKGYQGRTEPQRETSFCTP